MKKIWMILLILALLTGCGAPAAPKPADGKLHIVATVFPAYDFARAAAGDLADVELLLPPGTESHSYEPTPADILRVQNCDLFLYLGGESDSWVETILDAAEPTGQALAMTDCVETLEEEHTEGMQEEAGHHHEEHGDHDDHHHDHFDNSAALGSFGAGGGDFAGLGQRGHPIHHHCRLSLSVRRITISL